MKHITQLGLFAIATIAMLATASTANAQNGGGGHGGGSVETGVPLTISNAISINGALPSWAGTYTLTHASPAYYSFDSIQISLKGKPVNLPNGTSLHVTLYFSDSLTGAALPPTPMPNIVCSGGTALAKSTLAIQNPFFTAIYRHLDGVVVTALDGTVVVTARG